MDRIDNRDKYVSFTILCYRRRGVWLFDDRVRRTQGDVLLFGSQSLMEVLLREVHIWPGSHHGFDLTFTSTPIDAARLLTFSGRKGEGFAYTYTNHETSICGVFNPIVFAGLGTVASSFWVHLTRPEEEASLSVDLRSGMITVTETVGSLEAALATLRALLSEDQLTWLCGASDEELAAAHLGLGTQVRNSLGLWTDSPLMAWFAEQGITHPDDASERLLKALRAQLRRIGQ
ncbi:MAG: hypothetical protein EOP84_02530 [Verrucomicrobiaceae bacterium]|nr:MAG: hypothetical protein EOP84_02530 [Verrucomicrobiaceae bacterium]